ncbi:MAG: biotin--[acetyl-CoA-carboxylase] ligase [Caulobacteraceae bacterium]
MSASSAGYPVLTFASLDSTNNEARRRAEAGEGGPLWITTAEQTAGKGRRGRQWSLGPGDLAATLLITTSRPEPAQVSFVAALAVGDLVRGYVPPSLVAYKWPNDVLLDGGKVSGILIESGRAPAGGLWLGVGIGVNLVNQPGDVERPAAAIASHLRHGAPVPPSAEDALEQLSRSFARWFGLWEADGFAPIREAWLAGATGIGKPCVARLDRETVQGVAEGLDMDGVLIMRLEGGELRRIAAGDVFFPQGQA